MQGRRPYLQRYLTAEAFCVSLLRTLLDERAWRRHPAPFAKSERGMRRRQARRFARRVRAEMICGC